MDFYRESVTFSMQLQGIPVNLHEILSRGRSLWMEHKGIRVDPLDQPDVFITDERLRRRFIQSMKWVCDPASDSSSFSDSIDYVFNNFKDPEEMKDLIIKALDDQIKARVDVLQKNEDFLHYLDNQIAISINDVSPGICDSVDDLPEEQREQVRKLAKWMIILISNRMKS